MVYLSAQITKVETTKYSIFILICQLINEILKIVLFYRLVTPTGLIQN